MSPWFSMQTKGVVSLEEVFPFLHPAFFVARHPHVLEAQARRPAGTASPWSMKFMRWGFWLSVLAVKASGSLHRCIDLLGSPVDEARASSATCCFFGCGGRPGARNSPNFKWAPSPLYFFAWACLFFRQPPKMLVLLLVSLTFHTLTKKTPVKKDEPPTWFQTHWRPWRAQPRALHAQFVSGLGGIAAIERATTELKARGFLLFSGTSRHFCPGKLVEVDPCCTHFPGGGGGKANSCYLWFC